MFLTYTHNPNIPGRYADGNEAANLLRKGWVETEPPVVPEPVPEIPAQVETWALREACMLAGYTAQIEAAIAALPMPQKSVAMNRWEYKTSIRRNDPLIAALIQILGWTGEQADALFQSANEIQNS
jgi:hypothetical protein